MTDEEPQPRGVTRCRNDPANEGNAIVGLDLDPLYRKVERGGRRDEAALVSGEIDQARLEEAEQYQDAKIEQKPGKDPRHSKAPASRHAVRLDSTGPTCAPCRAAMPRAGSAHRTAPAAGRASRPHGWRRDRRSCEAGPL